MKWPTSPRGSACSAPRSPKVAAASRAAATSTTDSQWPEFRWALFEPFRLGDWSKRREILLTELRGARREGASPDGDPRLLEKLAAAVEASGAPRLAEQLSTIAAQ